MSPVKSLSRPYYRLGIVWGGAVAILGTMAVMAPFITGITVTVLMSVLMMSAGVVQTIYAFSAESVGKGVMRFLFGGLTLLAGVALIAMPGAGLATLTLILTAYLIADGLLVLLAALSVRPLQGWGALLFNGLITLALGALFAANWPATGLYAVGLVVGIRLIFSGWTMIALSARAEALAERVEEVSVVPGEEAPVI